MRYFRVFLQVLIYLYFSRENYEREITKLNKESSKLKIEYENCKLEYNLKFDEVNRLQKTISELNEFREKYYITEQQLTGQLNTSRMIQEKLIALQNDLLEKSVDEIPITFRSLSFTNDISYETMVENLKKVIQEQFTLRNGVLQREIAELKAKV